MTGTQRTPIRILMVEDHPLVRDAVASLLRTQTDLELLGQVTTAKEATAFLRQHPVEVVLLDIRLPDEDGLTVLAATRNMVPPPAVLVLSSHDGEAVIGRAFEGGALGFISKVAPAAELLAAVRDVARGKRFVSPDVSRKLASYTAREALKPRELEILEMIAVGLSNHEIGRRLGIAEKTVKNQLTTLFEKLGAVDRTHAVTVAVQRGLIELTITET